MKNVFITGILAITVLGVAAMASDWQGEIGMKIPLGGEFRVESGVRIE
jgi:hypothetical protein